VVTATGFPLRRVIQTRRRAAINAGASLGRTLDTNLDHKGVAGLNYGDVVLQITGISTV
jgi:hypothetical protein